MDISLLILDLIIIAVCSYLLLRHAELSVSHPALIYLFYHLTVVTFRYISILSGAPLLFSTFPFPYQPVQPDEIVRGIIYHDIALVLFTIGALVARSRSRAQQRAQAGLQDDDVQSLSVRNVRLVAMIAIPIGLFGLYATSAIPGFSDERVDLGDLTESSYITTTAYWVILSLLSLIYVYGFSAVLTIMVAVFVGLMGYQGYARNRVIVPLIILLQIYLDRRGTKGIPVWLIPGILALSLMFVPLKQIGRMAQDGAPIEEIWAATTQTLGTFFSSERGFDPFLDQFASTVTLVDRYGELFWGTTFMPILVSPIPREWWPEKPALNQYQIDISSLERPMALHGQVATYLGEAYANFGFAGIIVVPYLFSYFSARAYYAAYRRTYFSLSRFAYLIFAANLLLIYRDGLIAIPVRLVIQSLPLILILLLHIPFPSDEVRQRRQDERAERFKRLYGVR